MTKSKLDFVEWTKLKIKLEDKNNTLFINEREIWWASLGVNLGHEQDGKNESYERPVLVIKRFNNHVVWGLPMTTTEKKDHPYYVPVEYNDEISYVILTQIKLFSTKRFLRKVRMLPKKEYNLIKKKLKKLL